MKKHKLLDILLIVLPVAAVIFNALPNAVKMQVPKEFGEVAVLYFSGFSLVPVSCTVWGPMLAGLSAVLTAGMAFVASLRNSPELQKWMSWVAIYGAAMALSTVLLGSMTAILGIVCGLLVAEAAIVYIRKKMV